MKRSFHHVSLALAMLLFSTSLEAKAQSDNSNAKVYGIHEITLKPGVTEAEFETFVKEKVLPNWDMPGWNMSIIKGDRGDRIGGYIVLIEIESVAYRDRMAPLGGSLHEDFAKHWDPFVEKFGDEWDSLSTRPGLNSFYTDYYVIGQ